MANLDSLNLDINADASKAVTAIDSLVAKLGQLSTAMGGLANSDKLSDLAQGVSALSGAMGLLSGVRKDTFVKLSESLKTINETSTNNLENVSSGVASIAYALDEMQGLNTTGIEGVARSIKYLGSTTGEGGIANLKQLGTDLNQFANDLMFIPDTTQSVARITSVVDEIRRLGTKTGNTASTNFGNISTGLVKFINEMNGLNLTFDETKLTSLISSISRLGYASSTQAVSNLPNLTRELKNLFDTLARTPAISGNLVKMTQALANLTANLGGVRQTTQNASRSLDLFGNSAKRAKTHTKSLVSTIGMFYAKCFLLIRGVKLLGKALGKAMNSIEVQNYFENAIDQVAKKAVKEMGIAGDESGSAYVKAYSDKLSELKTKQAQITDQMSGFAYNDQTRMFERTNTKNLGINPNELVQYQAQFMQMADSMGTTADNASKLSETYTKLGADLASIRDVEFADAWSNMSSLMVGMSKVGDKYGINVRVAALNQELLNMGINTTVAKLNAEDKVLLRTIVALKASQGAWSDLANTIESPSNQLRILKGNFQSLGMTIANMLLPTITKILPYINALIKAIQTLFQWLSGLFGIEMPRTTQQATNNFEGLGDEVDDFGDSLDDASGKAKKLKNNLLGIDELNVISDNAGSSSSGAPSYNGDEIQEAFNTWYDKYMEAWNNAYNEMEDKIQSIADKLMSYFKKGDYKGLGKFISDNIRKALQSIKWDSIFDAVSGLGKGLAEFLNGLITPETFYEVGKTIANALNTAIYFFLNFGKNFNWKNFGKSLASSINGFFENFDFDALAEGLNAFVGGLEEAIVEFVKNVKWGTVVAKALDFAQGLDIDTFSLIVGAITIANSVALINALKGQLIALLVEKFGAMALLTLPLKIGITLIVVKFGFEFGKKLGEWLTGELALYENFEWSQYLNVGGLQDVLNGIVLMVTDWKNNPVIAGIGTYLLLVFTGPLGVILAYWSAFKDQIKLVVANIGNAIRDAVNQYIIEPITAKLREILYWSDTYLGTSFNFSSQDWIIQPIDTTELEKAVEKAQEFEDAYNYANETFWNTGMDLSTHSDQFFGTLANNVDGATNSLLGYNSATDTFVSKAEATELAMQKTNEITSKAKTNFNELPSSMQKYIKEYENATGKISPYTQAIEDNKKKQEEHNKALQASQEAIDKWCGTQDTIHSKIETNVTDYTNLASTITTSSDEAKIFNDTVSNMATTTMPQLSTEITNFSTEMATAETGFDTLSQKLITFGETLSKDLPAIDKLFTDMFSNIQTSMEDTLAWYDENIATILTLEYWNEILTCIPTAFETAFTNACTVVVNIVNRMIDAINDSVSEITWDPIEVNGEEIVAGGSAKLFKIPRIQGFEMGGYPDKASLFFMNENGNAEMLGNVGGRQAVVNNDQIVQAVSNGVEQAVAGVMLPYLSQIANNTERTANKDFGVKIGDRDIARANARGQRAMGRSIISTV